MKDNLEKIWVVEDIIMSDILYASFNMKMCIKFRDLYAGAKSNLKIRAVWVEIESALPL